MERCQEVCEVDALMELVSSDLVNKRARRSEPYFWNDDIEEATGRAFNWQCPFCDVSLQDTDYHKAHVWPVGYGVGVVPGNIVLTCPDCNMNMHDEPMWQWCLSRNINFGQMQFTLEILERIFKSSDLTVPDITFERKVARPGGGIGRVIEYLTVNPADAQLSARKLAELVGVGHDTANKGRNAWRVNQSANGQGE